MQEIKESCGKESGKGVHEVNEVEERWIQHIDCSPTMWKKLGSASWLAFILRYFPM